MHTFWILRIAVLRTDWLAHHRYMAKLAEFQNRKIYTTYLIKLKQQITYQKNRKILEVGYDTIMHADKVWI